MARTGCLLLICLLAAWGCRREPAIEDLVREMVVITNFEPAIDFASYETYGIVEDTIGLVSNVRQDDTVIVNNFSRQTIVAVKDQMNAAGYVQRSPVEDPDLWVNIYVVRNLSIYQQIVNPGFYPDPFFWGFGYGWYAPWFVTTAQNHQTLVIEIIDRRNFAANGNRYQVIWNAYIGDLYTSVDPLNNTLRAVGDAFRQTPVGTSPL